MGRVSLKSAISRYIKGMQKIEEFIENAREFERIYQFIAKGGIQK